MVPSYSNPVSRHSIWLRAEVAVVAERLDADYFVHAPRERGRWVRIDSMDGRIEEGLREVSVDVRPGMTAPQSVPTYRPLHIKNMTVTPDEGHLESPIDHPESVGPGDVVISKFLPVRAAMVTQETPRFPVDSNCVRIVGLEENVAFWVAAVMNHPTLREAWTRQAGSSRALPRLGVRDIKSLRIPRVPSGVISLACEWLHFETQRSRALDRISRFREQVQDLVRELAPPLPSDNQATFNPPELFDDVWLPRRIALRRWQQQLDTARWTPLKLMITRNRDRLKKAPSWGCSVLRLSEADGDLTFDRSSQFLPEMPTSRFYDWRLRPYEVLLSLMGSSPKVVFNHQREEFDDVIVSDHWVRLHPVVGPGAVALSLLTDEVRWQLQRSSSGFVQQFITHEDVAAIQIPILDHHVAVTISEKLCAALEDFAEATERQQEIMKETNALIDEQLMEAA